MQAKKSPTAIAAILMLIVALISAIAQAGQVRLSWDAPTTNEDGTPLTDLAGYMLYYGRTSGYYEWRVDIGNQTTYTLSGLEEGQVYFFSVTAYDTFDNESEFSNEVSANPTSDPPVAAGLMAAYAFDEGSGTTVADASGNNNTGTLQNSPVWTTGKMGAGLSFDGVNDYVTVPNSPSLDISGTAITISLWVNITDTGADAVILSKVWAPSSMPYPYHQYGIEFDGNGGKTVDFFFGDGSGGSRVFSMAAPRDIWTHIAFTYNGTVVKGYVDGVETLAVPESQSIQARGHELRIGVDGAFGQAFKGKIDQVRIYNRALTPSEIQTDMNTSIAPPIVGAPVAAFGATPTSGPAPLTVAFSDASSGSITAWSWDFGDGATSSAQHPSHTYTSPGSYTVSLTVTGPGGSTTATKPGYISVTPASEPPPVAAFSATPTVGPVPLTVTFSDASSGSITAWSWDFGDGATSSAQHPSHTYAAAGSYTVSLTVTGPGGSDSEVKTNYITVAASSTGLAAAYSFDEGKGTKVADASGNGNTGTLKNGPTWTNGKYGGALSFDGVNDHVLVPNSSSLDIAGTKLTLSLWVNITDRSGPDMVLLGKPWVSSSMAYPYYQYAIEFDANGAKTLDFMFGDTAGRFQGPFSLKPSVGVWTHVAFTYDGTTVKGYLNGVQKLAVPTTQSIQARGQSLRIGVDGALGQAFKGKMDQVRIYNRALTASEIQADMNTPIQ